MTNDEKINLLDEYNFKIANLKIKLKQTDYQAIKFAEGALLMSEYNAIKNQRAQWRAEINELEQKIKALQV